MLKIVHVIILMSWWYNESYRYWFWYILLDEKTYKTYKNIWIYDILCRTFMGVKLFCISFDEIDEFVKIYDGITF